MTKLQWLTIIVLGLTCMGVSYFYFAVSNTPTPDTVVKEITDDKEPTDDKDANTQKPTPPSNTHTNAHSKEGCGDGVCVAPETTNNCPGDC